MGNLVEFVSACVKNGDPVTSGLQSVHDRRTGWTGAPDNESRRHSHGG